MPHLTIISQVAWLPPLVAALLILSKGSEMLLPATLLVLLGIAGRTLTQLSRQKTTRRKISMVLGDTLLILGGYLLILSSVALENPWLGLPEGTLLLSEGLILHAHDVHRRRRTDSSNKKHAKALRVKKTAKKAAGKATKKKVRKTATKISGKISKNISREISGKISKKTHRK